MVDRRASAPVTKELELYIKTSDDVWYGIETTEPAALLKKAADSGILEIKASVKVTETAPLEHRLVWIPWDKVKVAYVVTRTEKIKEDKG